MLKINNRLVTKRVKLCSNPFSRARGLMFRSPVSEAYVFTFDSERSIPLHMWFVFFPIDILWLDANKKIIQIERNVQPWISWICNEKPAQYVVELPGGVAKHAKLGDVCAWRQQ